MKLPAPGNTSAAVASGTRLFLGSCDRCLRSLYAPASTVDENGRRLIVHPGCKVKGAGK